METLIRFFSAILDFFAATGAFLGKLNKPLEELWSFELLFLVILLIAAACGLAAFGPWTRRRRRSNHLSISPFFGTIPKGARRRQ
ncbi:hypothetical protein HNQ65_004216 [Prosthecobacter vanneervenii]|uniref:Uncharacterized protein n=1 Tax=Prosthecobacter vanneervenii TaxID=48466 RepID=A0A7W8DM76_9BACT|nr:hypothetical protein [Prosthecobacter vanneervenii]